MRLKLGIIVTDRGCVLLPFDHSLNHGISYLDIEKKNQDNVAMLYDMLLGRHCYQLDVNE